MITSDFLTPGRIQFLCGSPRDESSMHSGAGRSILSTRMIESFRIKRNEMWCHSNSHFRKIQKGTPDRVLLRSLIAERATSD